LFFIVQLVRGFAENRNHFPLMTHTSAYSFIRVARGADDTVEWRRFEWGLHVIGCRGRL